MKNLILKSVLVGLFSLFAFGNMNAQEDVSKVISETEVQSVDLTSIPAEISTPDDKVVDEVEKKACTAECEKACCANKGDAEKTCEKGAKKACKKGEKKECKKGEKKACKKGKKKACCSAKAE